MHYLFLLYSHVFLHSLLCLWSSRLTLVHKLYLSNKFFFYTALLPFSYIFPIHTIRVGKYSIGGIPYSNLLFQFTEIFIKQEYATGITDARSIIDAGANIGMATIYFAYYYPNAKIISIEPDTDTFAILKKNIEMNHLSERVHLVNAALGENNNEHVKLYHNGQPGRTTMSILPERAKLNEYTEVVMQTLSSHITSKVDILKMDIEGAEHGVIDEMEKSNKLKQVRVIVMEYHHILNNSTATGSLAGFLKKLEEAGFNYNLDTYRSPLFPHITQDILIGACRT